MFLEKINQIVAILAFIVFIIVALMFGYNSLPKEYEYHCHAKQKKMYKSIKVKGNVYLKTKEDCIDIRDIKEKKK